MDVYILLHNTTLLLDDTEKAWYSISTCTYTYVRGGDWRRA